MPRKWDPLGFRWEWIGIYKSEASVYLIRIPQDFEKL